MFITLRRITVLIKKQVFYDTDCLSSFLDINDWSILKSLFDEIIIPLAVYNEFFALGTPPHIIDNLNILVDEKFVKVQELNPFSDDIDNYLDICNEYELNNQIPIGEGEAQAMALVISNNGILASNNFRDIKYFVDKYKMPLLTSAYMISIAFDKGFISEEKAEDIWNQMWNKKVTLPEPNFRKYYEGKYKSDQKDFGKRVKFK